MNFESSRLDPLKLLVENDLPNIFGGFKYSFINVNTYNLTDFD